MPLSDGKLHTYGFIPAPSMPGTGPLINGVIGASAFGGTVTVAAGSWIEIYGDRLAESTRQWQSSDFSGSRAPVSAGRRERRDRRPGGGGFLYQPGTGECAGAAAGDAGTGVGYGDEWFGDEPAVYRNRERGTAGICDGPTAFE